MEDGLVKPKHLIMFGAGASAYSSHNRARTPPLGNNLLSAMHMQGSMAEILLKTPYYRHLFSNVGFEQAMEIAASDDTLPKNFIPTFQREICAFLGNFSLENDSTYSSLVDVLPKNSHQIGFISLNYDTLLEQSLELAGTSFYQHSSSYSPESIPLVKPHGSCNYLPETSELTMRDNKFRGLCQVIDVGQTNIELDRSRVKDWLYDEHNADLCPVISYYAKGKKTYCNGSFIDDIRKLYYDIVVGCSTLTIIGVKYTKHDEHIWDIISRSKCKVNLVEPNADNVKEFRNKFRKRLDHISDTFVNSIDLIKDITSR